MVELIVVLILMGVLTAVGVGRFFDRRDFDATALSDQIRASVRFAQKTAIAQNRPVYVRFNSNNISLCFDSTNPCSNNQQVQAPANGGPSFCNSSLWYCLALPQSVGVSVSLGPMSAGHYFVFDALGRPLSEAASPPGPPLAAAVTVTVDGHASAPTTISIEPETGYVH